VPDTQKEAAFDVLEGIEDELLNLISDLNLANEKEAITRSRELSLAITNLETGCLWLRKSINLGRGND